MRKFQKVTACIMAAALAATGCSGAGGAKAPAEPAKTEAAGTQEDSGAQAAASGEEEPVLVVYTARSEALNNAVIPEFEKDTGIKVEVVVAGTGELLKRAQSEKDNPLGDIFWVADQTMLSSSKDLFMEYVSPEDSNMLEAFRNNTGYFTPAFADPTVMIVNKDLKGDMKIDGFEDLLNPELKGKIAFADPAASSSSFEHLVNMLYAMGGGNPDNGWDYVKQFCAQLDGKLLGGSSAVYKGVADGEYTVGLTFEQGSAQYVGAGAPVKTVYMSEGVIFRGDGVYIIKGCPNESNAQKFVDWLTSKDVQEFMNNTQYRRTIRKDVEAGDAMVPMDQIKVIQDDETDTAAHKSEWLDEFKELFTE